MAPRGGSVKVAAVQLFSRSGEERQNLERIRSKIDEAADHGAELVVFSEAMNNGYYFASRQEAYRMATPVDGPFVQGVKDKARERNVFVALGILERAEPEPTVYNAGILIDRQGRLAGHYRKNFHIRNDKVWFVPGNLDSPVFDTEIGKFGIFICADARIPEVARCTGLGGAEVLLNLSNWGGPDQYLSVVPARGVENGCWVIAASKPRLPESVGQAVISYNPYVGNSFIMDPWGNFLARADQDTDGVIIYADIQPEQGRDKRRGRNNDLFEDRRPEAYFHLTAGWENTPLAQVMKEPVIPANATASVGILQPPVGPNFEENLQQTQALIREGHFNRFFHLLVLPELSLFDPADIASDPAKFADWSRKALDALTGLAAELSLYVVVNLVEEERENYYHTAFFIGPKGEVGRYRKVHLWDEEKHWAKAGSEFHVFPTPWGKVGIMLGYDGQFPESSRQLAYAGADLILWPTCWTMEAQHQFLARQRATENLVFVAAANRIDAPVPGPGMIICPRRNQQPPLVYELSAENPGYLTRLLNLSESRSKAIEHNTDIFRDAPASKFGLITSREFPPSVGPAPSGR